MDATTTPMTTGTAGRFTAVLLDLDGTITDSAPVILESLSTVFAEFGVPVPDHDTLMTFVGPPLSATFGGYAGLDAPATERALATYRRLYRGRMLDAPLYEGVVPLLRDLAGQGLPLALATSKNEELARAILDHWGLSPLFTAISGAGPGDRDGSKAAVIARALARLDAAGADTSRVVHVGDRDHDTLGAREAGVESIGVLWGYGDAVELADAQWLARRPADLAALLTAEALS
ncbi:MAG: HAD hydrolase-like protein [Actinomyces sp.]|uniref:HAD hydrolase-like protein n=1 Tax=Actinomyces sp. TaxID=29317 RepID=UPI0026DD8F36|nr:HAD hydrolase-like protein [Actinomyces sp.]MDO4243450.1 HAD hydrolase-like protein [Actinomyces sp.]